MKFSYVDPTRFDYWKRMEFTPGQWHGIKSHCDESGMEFLCSPFSCAAVDLLEDLGVRRYKIASGEITNHLMIEKIARTGKPIILSTGLSTYKDLDECVSFIKPFGNHVTILQCTTRYPTPAGDVGLNVIAELRERYRVPVGLSDHSGTIYPAIAAAALGAEMIEVHAVFDKMMFGPDSSSSLTMAEVAQLVHGVRFVEEALRSPVNKADDEAFKESRRIFGKSLSVNKDLKAGSVLRSADLEAKKPLGCGVPAFGIPIRDREAPAAGQEALRFPGTGRPGVKRPDHE